MQIEEQYDFALIDAREIPDDSLDDVIGGVAVVPLCTTC